MAPAWSRTQPVFLVRGACGDLIACTSDQWQQLARASAVSPKAALETDCNFVMQRSHASRPCISDHEAKTLVALEDASTASGHSDDDDEERGAQLGNDAREDGRLLCKRHPGNNTSGGADRNKRNVEDEQRQKEQLDELGLQRPLLVGPLKDFTGSVVGKIARRFGGLVQMAQVMEGRRSQSERCSLMLWLPKGVSVNVANSGGGWPVTVEDLVSGHVVVEDLKGVFPAGRGQVDKPVCVQQAKKHFVPGPGALNLCDAPPLKVSDRVPMSSAIL